MSGPPTGTVTFLFTDVEGSTSMWERDEAAMRAALARHDGVVRGAIESHGGFVFKTVGDAFCAAFPTAPAATEAALEAQRALFSEERDEGGAIRSRMALHTGVAEERDGDYFGPPLNRVARLLSAGHGGQTLLSAAAHEMVRDGLPAGATLTDLGERRLKDLYRPERVFQLVASGLPSSFPPLKTLEARPNNLSLQPTPLVGREREVAEVADRVRSPEVRLLTLTGPGGTGKTRLSLQAAADLLEEFEDGAFFVTLAAITDPELVASAIAGPLGVKERAEQPLTESLQGYLREKRLLLVLDNFEQVLEGATVVGELVAACPKLKVLATSRIPLRLYGEQEHPVPPLALPDPRVLPPVKVLTQYEAVRLFVERARAVKPDFSVTNENAPAVAEICARLDGLPLAIELAAARVKLLPPKALLDRLANRLRLLTGGARDLPARQRTLRGAIEWSHALLDEGEKTLFARLAVFAGGRTLEAVEAVCDAGGDLPVDPLDGVSSLLDKSLLRREEGPDGEPRFVMLETIHEYAREKLEEGGEAEEVSRRHAGYFLALAEEARPELAGPLQAGWFERLEAEHDNLRAALSWLLGAGETELGLRLGSALWRFWGPRGHLSEGRRWLEEVLAKSGPAPPASTWTEALYGLARLVDAQGDVERATALFQEGLRLSRGAGDKRKTAAFLGDLGWAALEQGDAQQRARGLLDEGLALSRELEDKEGTAAALEPLGLLATHQGDAERAAALFEESLALRRELGNTGGIATALLNLSMAHTPSDHGRARDLLEESLVLFRGLGDTGGVAHALLGLGEVALLRGDHERAKALLKESLMLSQELGMKGVIAETIERIAAVAGALGRAHRAARLWGASQTLREAIGIPMDPANRALLEPFVAAARSQLGEASWAEAWEGGRAMTLEEAVALALDEVSEARA